MLNGLPSSEVELGGFADNAEVFDRARAAIRRGDLTVAIALLSALRMHAAVMCEPKTQFHLLPLVEEALNALL